MKLKLFQLELRESVRFLINYIHTCDTKHCKIIRTPRTRRDDEDGYFSARIAGENRKSLPVRIEVADIDNFLIDRRPFPEYYVAISIRWNGSGGLSEDDVSRSRLSSDSRSVASRRLLSLLR